MRRLRWILALLAALAACERIVDLTPPPDGNAGPDTIILPDSDLDGGAIDDGGIEDSLFDTPPPDAT